MPNSSPGEAVDAYQRASTQGSGGGRGAGAATANYRALTPEQYGQAQAQREAAAAYTSTAPSTVPNAATEAAGLGASMPQSSSSSTAKTGPIGLDTLTGYTPYLTTKEGGVAKGEAKFYQYGSEATEWQDKPEADRVAWKQALWFAGFYGKDKPVLNGDIDPSDLSAMQGAMGLANLNGKSWQDAIAPRVTLGQQQGGAYSTSNANAGASGAFDQTVTQLRSFAQDNGLDLTDDFVGKQARAIAAGTVSADEVMGNLRDKYVARAYPAMADDIRAGHNVKDLAAPYVASMSKLLEIPEADVSLKDPTIARALQAQNEQGKPATVPLWQFEQNVKQDSRYQYTQGAWNDVGQQAYKVMQMFGLQG